MSTESAPRSSSGPADPMTPELVQAIRIRDIAEIVRLAVLLPIAWLLPERAWPAVGRGAATVVNAIRPGRARENMRTVRATFGDRTPPTDLKTCARDQIANHYVDRLLVLRLWRPGAWRPRFEVRGRDRLDRALAEGRGAVLWIGNFAYGWTMAKLVLHAAGYELDQLSHITHGFSETRFGVRVLNPIRRRIEDRFLRRRVRVSVDRRKEALAQLRRRLGEGGIVTVTATDWAQRVIEAPFLDGRLRLGPGAAVLAAGAAAPLLPVFVIREDDGTYALEVGPPLVADREASKEEQVADLGRQYARAHEPYVLAWPGQWRGWHTVLLGRGRDR